MKSNKSMKSDEIVGDRTAERIESLITMKRDDYTENSYIVKFICSV
jgi:hypothetical protein